MYSTEIIGKETAIYKTRAASSGLTDLRRLEGLDSLLTSIERWLEVFRQVPLVHWIGISYSIYAQFYHCVTLLSKLASLDEPGWESEEVRKRADPIDLLEGLAQTFERLPGAVGLVGDASSVERGVIFNAPASIRDKMARFIAEMPPRTIQGVDGPYNFNVPEDFATTSFPDYPWVAEMFPNM